MVDGLWSEMGSDSEHGVRLVSLMVVVTGDARIAENSTLQKHSSVGSLAQFNLNFLNNQCSEPISRSSPSYRKPQPSVMLPS